MEWVKPEYVDFVRNVVHLGGAFLVAGFLGAAVGYGLGSGKDKLDD